MALRPSPAHPRGHRRRTPASQRVRESGTRRRPPTLPDLIILLGAAATVLRAETTTLAGEGHYQALTRALNGYNAEDGSADDWNTWRTPTATPEARIDSLVHIMAHAQALLNERR